MSTLLDDIISLAIDGQQPLADILRKCLLLGHELKNERLKAWANQELSGYKTGKDVPDYRVIPAGAKGDFAGPAGRQFRGRIIPSGALKEQHRELAETIYLRQSVSAYADAIKNREGSLSFPWPPNLVAYYQKRILRGFVCLAAWQEVHSSTIAELLDGVRNITLNMALQIKDELGTSYTDPRKIESSDATKIQNIIFQNTGGNTSVAFGHARMDASGKGQTIMAVGDRKALEAVLTCAGLDKTDLENLTEAMAVDGDKPGSKVSAWVKDKAAKVLSGGIKVGTAIGSEILTAWLKQRYGL